MARKKTIPKRSEVAAKDTWDLSKLFATDAAWERAYKQLEGQIKVFATFCGKLGKSAQTIRKCLDFDVEFDKLAERVGSYAFLRASEDVASPANQALAARYTNLSARAGEAASFITPEIHSIPRKTMERFLKSKSLADYRFQLEKLLRRRAHILSDKEERLLAMQGEVNAANRRVFQQLTDADMTFGEVKNERGERVELSQGSFRSLLESPERSVRKNAFEKFYAVFEGHGNTLAATLSASTLQDVYKARVRNFDSAREAALFEDRVPLEVYDNLIATVHAHLESVYRYLDIRRRALKLRSLRIYDTYVPIVSGISKKTPYRQGVEMVSKALRPLGESYCKTLRAGLNGRWVDRYENRGKRSGAFSAGGFTGPPYILMNYKEDVVDSVFTLAHEAGHSMHTYYSARNQPYQYYGYTIFAAEVASTFNEQLLNHSLLAEARDKKTRAFLISREIDEIRGTLIRQTMFAEYEKIIHEAAERGEPLTLERLRSEYRSLLERYFGPAMVIDDPLSLEGLRIPHFYSAFYVYKYATGISAAIALAEQVLQGGPADRARYLKFLKSGGSGYPLDLLRDAGVDMASPRPVERAMNRFTELVDELDSLLS
jgi:oligoendopeptidase F